MPPTAVQHYCTQGVCLVVHVMSFTMNEVIFLLVDPTLWYIYTSNIIVVTKCSLVNLMNFCCYLMHVCAAGLCVWSRWFVYVCMYVYVWGIYVDKKQAVWGLTTGKSPVCVIYCSLVEFNG